jgi:hypothetical protein
MTKSNTLNFEDLIRELSAFDLSVGELALALRDMGCWKKRLRP